MATTAGTFFSGTGFLGGTDTKHIGICELEFVQSNKTESPPCQEWQNKREKIGRWPSSLHGTFRGRYGLRFFYLFSWQLFWYNFFRLLIHFKNTRSF